MLVAIILTIKSIKDFTMWITLTPYRAPFKRASQPPRKANDAGMNGRRKKHLDLQVAEGAEKRSDAVSNKNGGSPWEFHETSSKWFHDVPWIRKTECPTSFVAFRSKPLVSSGPRKIIIKSGVKTQSGMERRKRRPINITSTIKNRCISP